MEAEPEAVQTAADAAEQWVKRICVKDKTNALLVLCGGCGVGKTHILKALSRWMRTMAVYVWEREPEKWQGPPKSQYVRWQEVADLLKNKNVELFHDCFSQDVLFLDDVGAEQDPFKEVAEKFSQLLNRRADSYTAITMNYPPEAWVSRFDQRIADRLFRNSVIADFTGVDSYALRS